MHTPLTCLSLALTLFAASAHADDATLTQDDLLLVEDVTASYGGGGSLEEAENSEDGGVAFVIGLDPDSEGAGKPGYSRVALQRENWDADLTGSDRLAVRVTAEAAIVAAKLFVQTGDAYTFHESERFDLEPGVAVEVSLDLTGVNDADRVRRFGLSFFGHSETGTGFRVEVSPTLPATQESGVPAEPS